eukprot:UN24383
MLFLIAITRLIVNWTLQSRKVCLGEEINIKARPSRNSLELESDDKTSYGLTKIDTITSNLLHQKRLLILTKTCSKLLVTVRFMCI